MSNCRACSAPIRWAKTERGKKMPLDEKPETRAVVIGPELPKSPMFIAIQQVFIPHWATCPAGNRFRKRGTE